MSKIYEMLMNIKKRPGLYISDKSLILLQTYLDGYASSDYDHGVVESPNIFKGFQEFVQERYKITTSQDWGKIIQFFSISDAGAFDLFYKLLDEFLEKHPENLEMK